MRDTITGKTILIDLLAKFIVRESYTTVPLQTSGILPIIMVTPTVMEPWVRLFKFQAEYKIL